MQCCFTFDYFIQLLKLMLEWGFLFEFCEGESSFANVIIWTSDNFTFEFAIFSHFTKENMIVCFAYIYSPFTF